jgi:radical SAM protein with 4Fe4S-binding SPASM domain
MKAENSNVVERERTRLEDVLPLDTPYSLFIDVCNACNFKCKFCAIQTSGRELKFKKQVMDINLYKKIIDDIKEFRKPLKMLRLAASGEPLINKNLAQMIAYAKEKGVTEHIEIVSNGSLLNPQLNRELVAAGLDRIRISIEAADAEGYYQMSGVRLDWKEFKNNINDLYMNRKQCEIYIKTVDAAVETEEKKQKFYTEFGDMCDKISIEHIVPVWADYDEIYDDFSINREEGLHGHKIKDVECCPFPFYSFVIQPDGQVTACCADWEREIIVGDVNVEKVKDIWEGGKYKNFLMGMLENGKNSNHKTCAKCAYPCYDAVDNIDNYRMQILKKYKAL